MLIYASTVTKRLLISLLNKFYFTAFYDINMFSLSLFVCSFTMFAIGADGDGRLISMSIYSNVVVAIILNMVVIEPVEVRQKWIY